jgi:DNA-binding transcriptional LysR family regulator
MERLDLRLVEYFVAVAEELHFGRAAERLHIAQPSLSQQIRRLEQQLGVTLLDRTSRRVELTPAGKTLLTEGRGVLVQAQRVLKLTRAAASERLTVGFYGSAAVALLSDVLRVFTEQNRSIDVSLRELLFGSVEDILCGEVDVAFTRLQPDQTELEVEVIHNEPRVAALPASHPLAARQSLAFADLQDAHFITNPVVASPGPPTRWLAEQQRHGLPGRVAAEASSLQEILTLVATGRGVCLIPSAAARLHPRADVKYIEVRDADPAVVSLAWSRENHRPVVEAFVAAAREVATSTAISTN